MSWWFRRLSITAKLMTLMMVISSTALLLMGGALLVQQALQMRDVMQQQLSTLAEVIGSRTTAALTFADTTTAEENLQALRVKPHIVHAVIFDEHGRLFAEYHPSGKQVRHAADGRLMIVAQDILLEGESIGRIRITASPDDLLRNLAHYLLFMGLVVAVCFAIALLMSARLHRVISGPILHLREAMGKVSEHQDYSVRVEKHTEDELGNLIDGFNHMLRQIALRDEALDHHRQALEDKVTERTRELETANEKRLRWLETLAGFLRHELKNATIGVRTSLDLIERRSRDETAHRYVERARQSMDYMSLLLDSVGSAGTLEAAIYHEPKQRIDVSALVAGRVSEYRTMFPQAIFEYRGELAVEVLGQRHRLIQMLDKLIVNAVEHHRPGTPIRVSLERLTEEARLAVANQGTTLPADKERIFELFVSMRDGRHRSDENLGLGLYMVKLVVDAHLGQVRALDLKDPEGARFEVILPLLDAPGTGLATGQFQSAIGSTQR